VVKTRLQASGGAAFRAAATGVPLGGAPAASAAAAVTPARGLLRYLGTAKMLHSVWTAEGLPGMFRGFVPTLLGVGPSRALYFGVYNMAKRRLHAAGLGDTTGTHAGAAAMAGFASYTASSPLWVVKTRLQVQENPHAAQTMGHPRYSGSLDAVRVIYRQEGIRGFFQGISASYLGISEGVIQFVLYEKLKALLLEDRNQRRRDGRAVRAAEARGAAAADVDDAGSQGPPPRTSDAEHDDEEMGAAGFALRMAAASGSAKVVASMLTYPHEVLRTRLREQTRPIGTPISALRYHGLFHAMRVIFAEEGILAFYAGLSTHLIRVAPSSAVLFASYEAVSQLYLRFWAQDED
jgi:solute carrier family 25 protein 33/36